MPSPEENNTPSTTSESEEGDPIAQEPSPQDTKGRIRRILTIAVPIVGGMASQNILNLVDTGMVGTQGKAALAAVGLSSFVNFMCVAGLTGLSSGVQAMAARRLGEGRTSETAIPLNGGLLLAIGLGLPMCVVAFWAAPHFYPLLNDDPAVIAEGVPYLQARLVGMIAVAMNFSFRGYFNGINKSAIYFRTLVIMHIANVAISYCLIFGKLGLPELGATGAGIGTTISIFIGSTMYILMALKIARKNGFLRGLPDKDTMRTMLHLAIPSAIQQTFFAGGFVTLFKIIGLVGTTALAGANVVLTISMVAYLPALGLGLAGASLVGQSLGRGEPEDAKRWGFNVAAIGVVLLGLLGLPMALFPEWILGLFIHEQGPIDIAILPLRIAGMTLWIDGVGMVMMNQLFGAGDAKRVALVTISLQWLFFLPLAYFVGPVWGQGLIGIWLLQIGYRSVQSGILLRLWVGGKWQSIRV
ncbi:MAG: MATE family efflux transporter [Deltaproteobacteria bacterium]|nr:MATE family efflux transporter [Deltaproteobacteria bacterium]